jgi:hypothetical protein
MSLLGVWLLVIITSPPRAALQHPKIAWEAKISLVQGYWWIKHPRLTIVSRQKHIKMTFHSRFHSENACYHSLQNSLSSQFLVAHSVRVGRPRFDSRQGQGFFSLRYRFQTGCGTHPASYSMGEGEVVPVLNWAPRNERILGEWRYSSTVSWPRN